MDFGDVARGFRELWGSEPGTVILLGLAFVIFVFLVIDTWRHRRRRKRPR